MMTTRTGKALQKSHREKKSGSGHDQWVQRKRERNAQRSKQVPVFLQNIVGAGPLFVGWDRVYSGREHASA